MATRIEKITEMVAEYFGGYIHTARTSPDGQTRWLAENVVAYFDITESLTTLYTREVENMIESGELKFTQSDSGYWYFELPDRR